MHNNDVLKFKGEQFIFVPDNKLFVCITTEQNLRCMINSSDFFADGTFNYAPKHYIQLYTINCLQNGFYIPVVYFFLPHKSKQTYIDIWLFLQELSEKLIFKRLVIQKLHLDFEISACREVFPNVEIQVCRFHLGQCWWRKNSEQRLRTAYTNDDKLGKWLKLFFGLPFLSLHEIENAFIELVFICPNLDIGFLFSDYMLKTYVEDHCLFPPKIWAQEPSENPRTTNGSVSFHRTYNAQYHSTYPSVNLVIAVLKETQEKTCTKIRSVYKG
ncbi:uncharacterized protein LOC112680653, partial [Sipha flava]|uniref:Uncharacterized protein LOC112680653 n=1 Tax=Sipha flava TaxID=143950 RepID=A0A8B8F811_9HEMI